MTTVIKVGGSLLDLPDLRERLATVVGGIAGKVIVVPGGGPAADVVREYDRVHRLGDEASHWLALRACALNAHLLANLLTQPVTAGPTDAACAIVDLFAFALADEGRPDHFPHHWDVTSDSMAVRVAAVVGAGELILLKSTDIPASAPSDWQALARAGIVDAYFPTALERTPGLVVSCRNLRASPNNRR